MAFEQAYYTSCQTGLRGTKGFQMNAVSPGLTPLELGQMERYGLYVPPLGSPTMPTGAELALFPKALAFYRLQEGSAVLARSKYLGRDFSGRFGNFFTHFIVSKDVRTLLRALSPILAWEADFWVERELSDTKLPLLESIKASAGFGLRTTGEFLLSRGRMDSLSQFAACVLDALRTKKRVILVDSDEAIAHLIAAVSAALPDSLLSQLTFTTYCKNPYNVDFLVCGTTVDSDFAFSALEVQHQYFVLDFVKKRFSPELPATVFTRRVVEWYSQRKPEEADRFRRFVNTLGIEPDPEELDSLLILFDLANNIQVTTHEMVSAVTYLIGHELFKSSQLMGAVKAGLLRVDPSDPSVHQSVETLFNSAILHEGISLDEKRDTSRFFVEWLGQRILPQASPETVRHFTGVLSRHSLPTELWESSLATIKSLLENSRDMGSLSAILGFIDVTNLHAQTALSLESVVSSVLFPRLQEAESQKLLGEVFESSRSRNLDELIAGTTTKIAWAGSSVEGLTTFLSRKKTRERMKELARENRAPSILILARAFEIADSPNRANDVAALIDELQARYGNEGEDEQDVSMLFKIAWRDGPISCDDALLMLPRHSAILLGIPLCARLLGMGVLLQPDVLYPKGSTAAVLFLLKDARDRMSQVAGDGQRRPSVPPEVDVALRVAAWRTELDSSRNLSDKTRLIARNIGDIPVQNTLPRQTLMKQALTLLFQSGSTDQEFVGSLRVLDSTDSSLLLSALAQVLLVGFQTSPPSVAMWIRLFQFINEKTELTQATDTSVLACQESLRTAYFAIPKNVRASIDGRFAGIPGWREKWLKWKSNSSFAGRIKQRLFKR